MVGKLSIWNFAGHLRRQWLSAMSGAFSVPFAAAMVFSDSKYAQAIFAALALASLWFAAYRVWKTQYDKVVALEALAKNEKSSPDLAGVINAMLLKAIQHGFTLDDTFRQNYAIIETSTHPIWIADDLKQLRSDFLNRCGILGSERHSLSETQTLHKDTKALGETLISRLT